MSRKEHHGYPKMWYSGCRCPLCERWHDFYCAKQRERGAAKRAKLRVAPLPGEKYHGWVPKHGRSERYRRGCRCKACKRAWAIYQRVAYHYPVIFRAVEVLTDVEGPGFARLARACATPEVVEVVKARAAWKRNRDIEEGERRESA